MRMKKLAFFFLVAFSINCTLFAQQTLFVNKDYQTVVQQSKIEKKPFVIMFYANWCVHCNKMKKEVFTDKEVIDFYSDSYICVSIDAESNVGIALKEKLKDKFKVKSYPTFAFLDGNENLLYAMAGELKKDDFILEGKKNLIPENQINNLRIEFSNNVSNAENCIKYITALRKAGFDATATAKKFIETKNESNLYTEDNWKIIANGINDIESKEINQIVANKEKWAKVSSDSRVERKLTYVASDNLKSLAESLDTLNYYKKRAYAASFKIRKVDSLLFRYDLLIAENTNNWKNYKKITQENVENFAWKDSSLLTDIAGNFLLHFSDNSSLNYAVIWAKQAVLQGESTDKNLLIAKLYLQQKDKKNAEVYAEKAKALAVAFATSTLDVDKLLTEIKATN